MSSNGRSSRTGGPTKALLSQRGFIDRMDDGLTGVEGAQDVISMITSRRRVTKLILGHNKLSDDGCIVLFRFLASQAGRKYRITEISLNSNEIGDRGLLAIAVYLNENQHLTELFLQNNLFSGDPSVIETFTNSINFSHIEMLSLATNKALSDDFAGAFFSGLRSTYLKELHVSATGITRRSAPHIISYISSPERCHLRIFKCNGNVLGHSAVKRIIFAIEKSNFVLSTVELYSNHMATESDDDDTSSDDTDWKDLEKNLRLFLLRNMHLKRVAEKEALGLLRYSRTLLLPTKSSALCILPIELQLHILSFLAPSLSPAQRINVCTYASTSMTLPPLLPKLSGCEPKMCLPDPSSLGFSEGEGKVWEVRGTTGGYAGKCRDAVLCHKEQQQTKWLDAVGCSAYDGGSA
ncbi:RNI-like protein [Desarmillaria tabescens]|uniref:RNI-like protein n=1 Tax=Armillaria tabescens TaxID=1929756 RepID=A0AA39KD44_ARMTA|nr:RNI-like protein [Desarmillaria tabescens]KAK0458787.1 RNI-like protein [Desarmillaria tabescens]